MVKDREVRQAPPGWAVRTKTGHWLSYAHGYHLEDDAFFARLKDTEVDAAYMAADAQEDFKGGFEYDIVVAWEPLCEKLRHQVSSVKFEEDTKVSMGF